jgi:hypothetical protein
MLSFWAIGTALTGTQTRKFFGSSDLSKISSWSQGISIKGIESYFNVDHIWSCFICTNTIPCNYTVGSLFNTTWTYFIQLQLSISLINVCCFTDHSLVITVHSKAEYKYFFLDSYLTSNSCSTSSYCIYGDTNLATRSHCSSFTQIKGLCFSPHWPLYRGYRRFWAVLHLPAHF